ncbi:MAG: tetrathionate reductase family octaheme c-type cytochrome [Gammaproteobacteria bacterium]
MSMLPPGPGWPRPSPRRRRLLLAGAALGLAFACAAAGAVEPAGRAAAGELQPWSGPLRTRGPWTPEDHRKFKELAGPFHSPEEVTKACLGCHTDAAKQVKSTIHWTWSKWNPQTRQMVGKRNVFNTFCANITSNEQFCTTCHVGYGNAEPGKFTPFSQLGDSHVDCLVCHDRSGTYRKIPFTGGNPALERTAVRPGCGEVYGTDKPYVDPPDLAKIAQSVGTPTRENCGVCHFYGGGGDGVKHGDLDSSLVDPPKSLDVHMDSHGLNFPCEACHLASDHRIAGSHYRPDAKPTLARYQRGSRHGGDPATCRSCHGAAPHDADGLSAALNMHTRKVACQTCHIPEFARGGRPTKLSWNYSTAGKFGPNGTPLVINDAKGWNTYWGVKGSFRWGENVVPQYRWFNGVEHWMNTGDKIDPGAQGGVAINQIEGSASDGKSRIWPFKIMHNNQPYDPVNKTLAVFHSFGFDDNAFTITGDWQKAIRTGMQAAHLPYSGHFAFVPTYMYWPITHMVAPKEQALRCSQCHADGGRLAAIAGVYLPGRSADHQPWIERLGLLAAALGLLGVLGHGGIRAVLWLLRRRKHPS